MGKKLLIGLLVIGSISMLFMSFHYFQNWNDGILKRKDIAQHLWYIITFRAHIFFGLVAIIVGPVQFLNRFRIKHLGIHKTIGYVYFLSVILSSLTGLVIAQYAMGGLMTVSGFTFLSILWLLFTIKAVLAILRGHLGEHRRWSFLSYSLTFAAITQRVLLLLPLLSSVPFIPVYRLSAWLPWILNLALAQLLLKMPSGQKHEGKG